MVTAVVEGNNGVSLDAGMIPLLLLCFAFPTTTKTIFLIPGRAVTFQKCMREGGSWIMDNGWMDGYLLSNIYIQYML